MIVMRPLPPVTDEEALLAAVAAAPLDDAPRLVYADWLQEHGADEEADYVRAVVSLSHPPEDRALVERCVALAEDLDADWRQAVGGRFEVVLHGAGGVHLTTLLVSWVARLWSGDLLGPWQAGDPIRLRAGLTREDAEAFLQDQGLPLLRLVRPADPEADVYVRPMGSEAPPTLFAPTGDD
jgi:uncharacterized protein (TIGR02996 family)